MYALLKQLLFRFDPEDVHEAVTHFFGAVAQMPGSAVFTAPFRYSHPALPVTVAGVAFPNPVGLAAGFDKNACIINAMAQLGFGFAEIGTVTPRPQPGNPKPRLFRLPEDRAIINRMGFNGEGAAAVVARLESLKRRIPVGVNIGKNKDTPLEQANTDYVAGFEALARFADYVTVNVSSPNTPGLRQLQERASLEGLLASLVEARTRAALEVPVFLKISPDETDEQLDEVLEVVETAGIDGIILSNTTVSRPASLRGAARAEQGGLSGPPLRERSTAMIRRAYRKVGGRLPIIGVGGIDSADAAYEKILAGASLVQVYTGLIYEGPALVSLILKGLVARLARDGYASIADAVGKGA